MRDGSRVGGTGTKRYMCLHLGGTPSEDVAEQEKGKAAWMAWFETLGDKVVEGPAPLGERRTLGAPAQSTAAGYFVIEAPNLAAAVALAKGCPAIAAGESIEVLEIPAPPL